MSRIQYLEMCMAGLLSMCGTVSGGTNYVWLASPNPTAPYTNWYTAATNIQQAINAAQNGNVVLVTNGVYYQKSQIAVAKGITVKSLNGPDVTIVDGCATARCFYVAHSNAVLDGFTVTHGYWLDVGGALVYGGNIINCVLISNTAQNNCGGLYLDNGTASNCVVFANDAAINDGVYSAGSLLISCAFASNIGLGACCVSSEITSCMFVGNLGAGAYCVSSQLASCMFVRNSGDGVDCIDCSLTSCTAFGNSGGGAYCEHSQLASCISSSNAQFGFHCFTAIFAPTPICWTAKRHL